MSYSPSTMSDDNKPPPDPRYHEWDTRSRKELGVNYIQNQILNIFLSFLYILFVPV